MSFLFSAVVSLHTTAVRVYSSLMHVSIIEHRYVLSAIHTIAHPNYRPNLELPTLIQAWCGSWIWGFALSYCPSRALYSAQVCKLLVYSIYTLWNIHNIYFKWYLASYSYYTKDKLYKTDMILYNTVGTKSLPSRLFYNTVHNIVLVQPPLVTTLHPLCASSVLNVLLVSYQTNTTSVS